jgi:hypothetical protein
VVRLKDAVYRTHTAQPTTLVLSFSTPLNPTAAQDVRNYGIIGPGGRFIRVDSALYLPGARAVVLRPHLRLNIHFPYVLFVNGTGPGGVRDVFGNLLDGAGTGRAGSNYVATVSLSNLVLPGIWIRNTPMAVPEKASQAPHPPPRR